MKKQISFLLLTACSMLSFNAWAADYEPKIIAGVVKADSWTMNNNHTGIYQLEVKADGSLTQLNEGDDVYLAPLGGAVYTDGTMHGIHFRTTDDPYTGGTSYTIYHVAYDMQTWQRTLGIAMSDTYANLISSCGIAHDPETGLDFGIFYNFNLNMEVLGRRLATIDFSKDRPSKSIIDDVMTPFAAIAFSPDGLLYGVGQDGYLYIIDKTDATLYPLGDLGISDISTYPSSMTFDPRTKKLYWSYVTKTMKSVLYEISYNLLSVSATKIMDVPDNAFLVNLYIAPTTDGAPAAATDLALGFEGEQTTGTVSFTMPTTTQDNEPLTGQLTYTILANGTQIATGTAEAGAAVNAEVTVPTSGETEISVVISNESGESPALRTSQYIGFDTPLAATNVQLSFDNTTGMATLTWTAPTEGTHSMTLTPANLTYNVVRQPAGVTVATGISDCTFSESLTATGDLTSYYYKVTVLNGELTSEAAASNTIVLGDALTLPFYEDFTTDAGFNRFTVIDSNADGKTWTRFHKYYQYSGTTIDCASITAGYSSADDDWLLTPQLQIAAGTACNLTFYAHKAYASVNYNQYVEVWYGQGDDITTYTKLDDAQVFDVNDQKFSYDFTITANGLYRVALHAISPAGSDQLLLNSISITGQQTTGIKEMRNEEAEKSDAVFTLDGRRITNGHPSKGLYIKNGHKVVIK